MTTLDIYEKIIAKTPNIERKGKANPYTSANGHMFSQMNKDGQLGFRYSKADQETYFKKFDTTYFKSYGAVMKGYILITDDMLKDETLLCELLQKSHEYVLSLEPQSTKKK